MLPLVGFFHWHYLKGSSEVITAWLNFVRFPFYFFSVSLQLKTLLAPWRRVAAGRKKTGLSLSGLANRLTFNLVSRVIGLMVRLVFVSLALTWALINLILGGLLLPVWLLLVPLTWIWFLNYRYQQDLKKTGAIKAGVKRFVFQRLGINSRKELKKLPPEQVKQAVDWYWRIKERQKKNSRFWRLENLLKAGSLGEDLAFGYTLNLDKCSEDLSFPPPFAHQLVGRKKEIKQLETVLTRRTENNCLLVGEPGVGKRTILLGLAKAIKERRVNPELFFYRILLLDMSAVLGQSLSPEKSKARFADLLEEAQSAGNIILAIDQLDKYLSPDGRIDLTSEISHLAQTRGVQLIGVTTPTAYERTIFPNERIMKYFEKITVTEPSQQEALKILMGILPQFEKGKRVTVTLQALQEIIDQSQQLISHIPFPEKAIDLLDELINQARSSGLRRVGKKEVDQLISRKTKVPVGVLSRSEETKLKNLETILHQRIVNQNQAVKRIAGAMKRARVGIADQNRPIGTFLFLGPTGVGKTETAKALAAAYFNSEDQLLRLDMAQSFELKFFAQQVREKPFGVLLLDEFEKASQSTQHLFLTVLDEGYLKGPLEEKLSFKNMIIICTSNAGAEFIRQQVESQPKLESETFSQAVIDHVLEKGFFSPELINRFDGTIVFQPLKKAEIKKIAQMQINQLGQRLAKKQLTLSQVNPAVYHQLAEQGHSRQFGARPMKRLIANKIEELIAQEILANRLSRGDRLKLTLDPNTQEFKIERLA